RLAAESVAVRSHRSRTVVSPAATPHRPPTEWSLGAWRSVRAELARQARVGLPRYAAELTRLARRPAAQRSLWCASRRSPRLSARTGPTRSCRLAPRRIALPRSGLSERCATLRNLARRGRRPAALRCGIGSPSATACRATLVLVRLAAESAA